MAHPLCHLPYDFDSDEQAYMEPGKQDQVGTTWEWPVCRTWPFGEPRNIAHSKTGLDITTEYTNSAHTLFPAPLIDAPFLLPMGPCAFLNPLSLFLESLVPTHFQRRERHQSAEVDMGIVENSFLIIQELYSDSAEGVWGWKD